MSIIGTNCYVELPIRHYTPSTPNRPSPSSSTSTTTHRTQPALPPIIYTQPTAGPSSFLTRQSPLPPPTLPTIPIVDDQDVVEDILSFRKAQLAAKTRVRKLPCLWRDCDAQLASIHLLQKVRCPDTTTTNSMHACRLTKTTFSISNVMSRYRCMLHKTSHEKPVSNMKTTTTTTKTTLLTPRNPLSANVTSVSGVVWSDVHSTISPITMLSVNTWSLSTSTSWSMIIVHTKVILIGS